MKRKNTVLAIGLLLVFLTGLTFTSAIFANNLTDEVTVGNSPPELVIDPSIDHHESDEEGSISRTTFSAVGRDSNGDTYYMIVCASDGIHSMLNGQFECNSEMLCISDNAESDTEVNCRHHSEYDLQIETSYLYLCDNNIDAPLCSEAQMLDDQYSAQSAGIISSISDEYPELEGYIGEDVLGATTENSDGSGVEFKYTNQFLLTGALLIITAISVFLLSHVLKHESANRRAIGFLSFAIVVMVSFYGLTALVSPSPDSNTSSGNIQGVSKDRNPEDTAETVIIQRASKAGLYEIFMEPDLDSKVVYYAAEGEPFPVLEEDSGWLLILLPNGVSGWIPKSNSK